ncbi:hypothetical protein QTP88_022548 [Uroleucon formosanum]
MADIIKSNKNHDKLCLNRYAYTIQHSKIYYFKLNKATITDKNTSTLFAEGIVQLNIDCKYRMTSEQLYIKFIFATDECLRYLAEADECAISVRSYLGHLHDVRAWALIEHHSHRLARQVKITGFVTTGFFNTFRVYNYLKRRRRRGARLTVAGTYVLRWVCGPEHSKRRDFERGYRKGLTDSVHNFSRELIAEGLKPPANYLCGRPIPTNSRRDAEGPATAVSAVSMEGGRGCREYKNRMYKTVHLGAFESLAGYAHDSSRLGCYNNIIYIRQCLRGGGGAGDKPNELLAAVQVKSGGRGLLSGRVKSSRGVCIIEFRLVRARGEWASGDRAGSGV